MRIYILDDCEILRVSLALVFQQEEELDVLGTGDSSGDPCQKVLASGCDTLLIGLRLRNFCGLEIIRRLRAAGTTICIIALGYSSDATNVKQMYQAGADSFISVSTNNDEMVTRVLLSKRNLKLSDFSLTASSDRLPQVFQR